MPATIVFGSHHGPISASRLMRLAASTALAVALLEGSAHTAEIRLLSAAAMQSVAPFVAFLMSAKAGEAMKAAGMQVD
jgi:hypothetical protein